MKNLLMCTVFLVSISSTLAQELKPFPEIPGITLQEVNIVVPKHLKGKVTMIGLAYSQKSDDLLKKWFDPIYKTFIAPEKVDFIPQENYDLNIMFVAMIRGIAKSASGRINDKMQKEIDKKMHRYVMTYTGSIAEYKEPLGLGDKDLPYFYLLDKDGNIVYATSGAYSEQKMDELKEAISKL